MKKIIFIASVFILIAIFSEGLKAQVIWSSLIPTPNANVKTCIYKLSDGSLIVGGESYLLMVSRNNGIDWETKYVDYKVNNKINKIFFLNNQIGWVGGDSGMFLKTTDNGISWSKIDVGSGKNIFNLQFLTENIGYLSGSSGLFMRTTDGGLSWQDRSIESHFSVTEMSFINENTGYVSRSINTICGGYGNMDSWLHKTTDSGVSWLLVNSEYNNIYSINFINSDTGFIGGRIGCAAWENNTGRLSKTTNGGRNWTFLRYTGNPLPILPVREISIQSGSITLLTRRSIHFSSDFGNSWSLISTFQTGYSNSNGFIAGDEIFFVDNKKIFKLFTPTLEWSDLNKIAPFTNAVFVNFLDENLGFIVRSNSIVRSTDSGMNWETQLSATGWFGPISFFNESFGSYTNTFGIYKTSNSGNNWIAINNLPSMSRITDVQQYDENNIFAIGNVSLPEFGKFIKSNDFGNSWTEISLPVQLSELSPRVKFNDLNTGWIYTGNKIITTFTSGSNWNIALDKPLGLSTAGGFQSKIIAASNNKIYTTSNYGDNWDSVGIENFSIQKIEKIKVISPNTCYIGVQVETPNSGGYGRPGILKSHNGGNSWILEFLPVFEIPKFDIHFINENTGWITGFDIIFKTTNAGVTFIQHNSSVIPENFLLHQNYPNPFNPVTNIKFSIPTTQYTVLKIFDITGREITTLVNEQLNEGEYNIQFSIDNYQLSSGVYFYQLKAGDPSTGLRQAQSGSSGQGFIQTRKMLLIK